MYIIFQAGANIEAKNTNGQTPLKKAVETTDEDTSEVIQVLIEVIINIFKIISN